MKLQENVSLAPYTTFGVGGPARYFTEATCESDVRQAIGFADTRQVPLFVIGGGSNLLVSDEGFPGIVLRIAIHGIDVSADREKRLFQVAAGEDWDEFVALTVAQNCAGLECLSGIPGTVGASPVQNIGAYGQEVSDTISQVYAIEIATGRILELPPEECGFGYRSSLFNTEDKARFIILGVRFSLVPDGEAKISYRDLQQYFDAKTPSLSEVRKAVREIRHRKGMLIVEGDPDCRSAGSFFKNPIISLPKLEEIKAVTEKRGVTIPIFPAPAGHAKVPAAWLVEQSGFAKGYTKGPAGISNRHTLAIVNRGGAKASDILALKEEIQKAVNDRFGIELKPEPVMLGGKQAAAH